MLVIYAHRYCEHFYLSCLKCLVSQLKIKIQNCLNFSVDMVELCEHCMC